MEQHIYSKCLPMDYSAVAKEKQTKLYSGKSDNFLIRSSKLMSVMEKKPGKLRYVEIIQ